MRLLPPALGLLMSTCAALAAGPEGIDWQLLAIDGVPVDVTVTASLRIETDGAISGKAPCNAFAGKNTSALPAFTLGPIRATRMACDKLADEQAFFDALSVMQSVMQSAMQEGGQNLILTGPDGRSMEFVQDRTVSPVECRTCAG